MSQSLEPPSPNELDAFEQKYPSIGRWIRLLTGLFKPKPWREIGDTAGKNPAFESSWVNFDTGDHALASFYLDPFNRVHIKGLVKTGAPPSIVFTLPAGYLPPEKLHFPIASNGAFGYLSINILGQVRIEAGSSAWADINVSFRV